MVIDYMLIGYRIKARRVEKGLTQENIAEHLGISVSYVSRVERAAVKISLETLVKISIFLETSPAFLLDGMVVTSGDYLQGELADSVDGFSPEQMRLLLDIAKAVKRLGDKHP